MSTISWPVGGLQSTLQFYSSSSFLQGFVIVVYWNLFIRPHNLLPIMVSSFFVRVFISMFHTSSFTENCVFTRSQKTTIETFSRTTQRSLQAVQIKTPYEPNGPCRVPVLHRRRENCGGCIMHVFCGDQNQILVARKIDITVEEPGRNISLKSTLSKNWNQRENYETVRVSQ